MIWGCCSHEFCGHQIWFQRRSDPLPLLLCFCIWRVGPVLTAALFDFFTRAVTSLSFSSSFQSVWFSPSSSELRQCEEAELGFRPTWWDSPILDLFRSSNFVVRLPFYPRHSLLLEFFPFRMYCWHDFVMGEVHKLEAIAGLPCAPERCSACTLAPCSATHLKVRTRRRCPLLFLCPAAWIRSH
jgi:hypothetical protein